ncbi:telomerase-binding protein EST1A [Leguminivora glycinivorella]|uniref:telomerase-binding protein EST1A n=1 Tax=Leguminivora glycinivorella TaxID=1035111 RepID=UPI00200DEFD2|nr:telomerase-binding protein EST1A [Leguminivora glycinivorella]
MDDECNEYRRSKPQQKLYKPGSGPLRRSGNGFDGKMDSYEVENGARARSHYGSHNSVNDLDINASGREHINRHKKPEQQLYVPKSSESGYDMDRQTKAPMRGDNNSSQYMNRRMSNKHDNRHGFNSASGSRGGTRRDRSYAEYQNKDSTNNDINYNRHYRQVSEPRAQSPTHPAHEVKNVDRNRDSRSMEASAGRQLSGSGAKPPTGRRNSAGYATDSSRPKYMVNLDNIPPRFRKKFLEQSGHHSFDSMDQKNKQFSNYSTQSNYNQGPYPNTNSNWSQTLPSRGRGRLRDNDNFDREKFINSYLKNYEVQNSRRSTPSNSYLNLSEPSASDDLNLNHREILNQKSSYDYAPKNGIIKANHENTAYHEESQKHDSDTQDDTEAISHSSSNLLDMTNLDWTEEVEKNIKLDDMCDTSASFSQNIQPATPQPVPQEVKPSEPRESKRRSRRRDKRSSSRGQRNSEKKAERNRKDSNVSIQHDAVPSSIKNRDRERRDSYKSNRSSTIGNSRDDLDHWRSLRSYSREQSTEGRIVSQCNSRDVSAHRALSPRDHDGFRVPAAVSKNALWSSNNQKKVTNGGWAHGRTGSIERRQSPAAPAPAPALAPEPASGGGRRRAGKRSGRRRRNAENIAPPVPQPPGATPAPTTINWREEILESKKHTAPENTHQRNRLNSVMSDKSISETSTSQPGLLILPQSSQLPKDQSRGGSVENQKTLYDYHNPSKPIIVQTSPTQMNSRMERGMSECGVRNESSDSRGARHRELLQQVDRADAVLHARSLLGPVALDHWHEVAGTRIFLQDALKKLLMSDLKYCQAENVEHNFWKILYYNFIEKLRRNLTQVSPEDKVKAVKLINIIIEEGNDYFENLVQLLEKTYKFNTDDFINDNHVLPPKGLGFIGLALISVQKLYIFLGDLTRYKEQINETNNFAKSKFWYTKAQQINPKNGRPYNQLAILAVYARRKLDAVYYYMRSLMSSNPFASARESLLSLFDENRKKYEAAERKRRAAAEGAQPTENGESTTHGPRREVWVRPSGHRTTTVQHDSLEERLANMTPVELNKNFITSYLHVHGKLITKIGMETFHESASQMLRQFRALLHRQPLPTPAARLLQLTALNMFAVEATVNAKGSNASGRSAWLDCALGVSLLMFGAMLERCCALLPEPEQSQHHADALLLLPAIKVWSDWMLCHSSVWNPPPSFDNFEIGTDSSPWDWLAKLMNILEDLDDKTIELESESKEGYVSVRLAEDSSLAGFTPLMYMEPAAAWARADPPAKHHAAEHALRTRKLLFFGTEYLVGVDPPVLRLEYPTSGAPRYVSAVQHVQHHTPLRHLSEDSEDEDSTSAAASGPPSLAEADGAEAPDEATRRLLRRKEQLENRKANLERRRQRMQEMLRVSSAVVEVEVRPRWLVPDTNCFIDHLPLLRAVAAEPGTPYQLAVPLIVMTELEGLRKCSRVGPAADAALAWLGGAGAGAGAGVRFATSKGSLLATRAFAERDQRATNDDRVLATALNLHANIASEPERAEESGGRLVWEVVLLTDDRNLRVKALAAELPARDLPSFVSWAGLTPQNSPTEADNEKAVSSK